jgi:hypothetical protein
MLNERLARKKRFSRCPLGNKQEKCVSSAEKEPGIRYRSIVDGGNLASLHRSRFDPLNSLGVVFEDDCQGDLALYLLFSEKKSITLVFAKNLA